MGVRVGVGLGRFPFDDADAFRGWLELCDESRVDSIWQSDRVVSNDRFMEPLSLLSVVAGATRRLKFGMNAVVLGFRDPVTFARQCATLDVLSGGRLLPMVGVGAGESPDWKATGRSPRGRGARADEALEIITRLWREESVSFEGEHFRLEEASISPRPLQQPLPLWIGGSSAAAVRRTVRFGNGWLAPLQGPEEAGRTVEAIREEGRAQGRPIPDDHFGASILYRIEAGAGESAGGLTAGAPKELRSRLEKLIVVGGPEAVLDRMRAYCAVGIEKFIAIPMVKSQDEFIEQTRLLDTEVIPEAMTMAMTGAAAEA